MGGHGAPEGLRSCGTVTLRRSIGIPRSVSLVVSASRGGSEHGLTLRPVDRLAQQLCRHAVHGGIGAARTRRSLGDGVGHRVVESQ